MGLLVNNDNQYVQLARDPIRRAALIKALQVRRVLATAGFCFVLIFYVLNELLSFVVQRQAEPMVLGTLLVFLLWATKLDLQVKALKLLND